VVPAKEEQVRFDSAVKGGSPTIERIRQPEYPDLPSILPVQEDCINQLEPGDMVCHTDGVANARVGLVGMDIRRRTIGWTAVKAGYVGMVVPVRGREFSLSNQPVKPDRIFVSRAEEAVLFRGERRSFFGITIQQAFLEQTIAALRGVDPDEVRISNGMLRLPPGGGLRLIRSLAGHLQGLTSPSGMSLRGSGEFFDELTTIIIDAYLAATQPDEPRVARCHDRLRIVRRAEEHFLAQRGQRISLADLCTAAGVGRSALNMAFHEVTGMSPLRYLRARRLNEARVRLSAVPSGRGAVGQVAMDCGFTELGRFAGEYRQLFGVSPSMTLTRS